MIFVIYPSQAEPDGSGPAEKTAGRRFSRDCQRCRLASTCRGDSEGVGVSRLRSGRSQHCLKASRQLSSSESKAALTGIHHEKRPCSRAPVPPDRAIMDSEARYARASTRADPHADSLDSAMSRRGSGRARERRFGRRESLRERRREESEGKGS